MNNKLDPAAEIKKIEGSLSVSSAIRDKIEIDDAEHRRIISKNVIDAFIKVNAVILVIIVLIFLVESYIAYNNIGYMRVVDSKAIMTLIGATTVQFGAMAIAISNWLFPRTK